MVRDALMRVMETWNREGTVEAIWSSLLPQARISPGSPGVQLYTTLGDKEKHHSRWGWGRVFPSHLQHRTSFLVIHSKEPQWKGEGTTSFPTVYGASCTFKKAHPFGYEYVCMCVSSRVCTCVCTCVHPSRQRAQKDFLSCVGGY